MSKNIQDQEEGSLDRWRSRNSDDHLVERSYGAFARSVQLPSEVQSDKISTAYRNGILKIILPKSEEAKKKEIKIKVH